MNQLVNFIRLANHRSLKSVISFWIVGEKITIISKTLKKNFCQIIGKFSWFFTQVAAGGVHSLVLTAEGAVFSCGINEKGTVPVEGLEAEGSTDTFREIVFAPELKRLGQIVQITAGASCGFMILLCDLKFFLNEKWDSKKSKPASLNNSLVYEISAIRAFFLYNDVNSLYFLWLVNNK